MKYFIFATLFLNAAFAAENFLDSVNRMKWKAGRGQELDVVWIEDNKFPTFTASIYFQDGAVSDGVAGITQVTFDQLTAGTKKETQREIAEFFDFYGANLRHTVTHEYSVFSVQALTKDMNPVMAKVCELFTEAQYPENELKSHVARSKSQLKNLVTSHAGLADRVFRRISLEGTPYSEPVEGTFTSLDRVTPELLRNRLDTLNKTKKILYLAGPAEVKGLENVLANNCRWTNENFANSQTVKKPAAQSAIYLVEVPNANQAQIRIGRMMTSSEFEGKFDQFYIMSNFLGGGFTSKLVQELRVKRGLTYSAGAYVSLQRDYGRAGIMTFSKNETSSEAVALVRDVLADVSAGKFTDEEFTHHKNHQIGAFVFGFEETNAFLGQIMLYDHQRRDLRELASFRETIEKMSAKDLARSSMEALPWEKLTIVIVGDRSLVNSLSRVRPVRVVKFEDYL